MPGRGELSILPTTLGRPELEPVEGRCAARGGSTGLRLGTERAYVADWAERCSEREPGLVVLDGYSSRLSMVICDALIRAS